MRRVNGYHILSTVLACLGAAAWAEAALGRGAGRFAAVSLLVAAAGCVAAAVRSGRRERAAYVRQLRQAAAALRPAGAGYAGACVDAASFGAAVDGLVAASRARAITHEHRIRELELQLKAASLERDHAQATVARLAAAARHTAQHVDLADAVGPNLAAARDLNRVKRDFVSLVSHEFRTPLAGIKAYAEMLLDGEAADARSQREFYDVIHAEACRLGHSIDNVLGLTRLQAGLATPARRPTPLREVVDAAAEAVRPLAGRRRQAIQLEPAPAGQDVVSGDRELLVQAVINLLDNAVKHTPRDGRVTVRTIADPAAGTVRLRVEDAGNGLEPKDLPALFDTTYSEGETGRRNAPGPGLGLALARHVVEQVHGGRMTVEAEPGRGSCFGFELPLGPSPAADDASAGPGAAEPRAGEQTYREPTTR